MEKQDANEDGDGNKSRRKSNFAALLCKWFNEKMRPLLRSTSFITIHYTYFIATCLISSLIFWGSSTPSQSVRYIDAVFLTTSAMTEAGLNTINLSTLNTWQQVILFLLIMMGSAIFVSSAVIHVRKRAFEMKLQELADRRQSKSSYRRSLSLPKRIRRLSGGLDSSTRAAQVASGAVRGQPIHDPPMRFPDSMNKVDDNIDSEVRNDREEAATASGDEEAVTSASPVTNRIHFADQLDRTHYISSPTSPQVRNRIWSQSGVGTHSLQLHPRHSQPLEVIESANADVRDPTWQSHSSSKLSRYFDTVNGYVGRNSQFHQLTEKERRKLGGIEYDALCLLSWLVPAYFVLFQLGGAVGCGAWMQINMPNVALENGLNPFWTGAFFAISAFNNSGMALLDANATVLQNSYYMLLTLSFLILAGNTCFPPFLRLILWSMKNCIPTQIESERLRRWRQVLEFILEHPRRVYTNLFPSEATWWLVASLVLLNGIDWFAFEILNLGNSILTAIPARYRVLDGLFQAFAVRAGGFYVVTISSLYPGTLVMYVLMMYLSAFPVSITMRNTNVYEERSLAIFGDDIPSNISAEAEFPRPRRKRATTAKSIISNLNIAHGGLSRQVSTATTIAGPGDAGWGRQDFIRQQLRGQLGHDLWWLGLAVFFISIIETSSFLSDPVNFSIFNIIFEVVSAYGTVGISVGVPWAAYSFCGAWHTGSKLVLCAVMLRGRHRGLPVAIDRAILLPDSSLAWAEEEDGRLRRTRTMTSTSAFRRPSFALSPTDGPDRHRPLRASAPS